MSVSPVVGLYVGRRCHLHLAVSGDGTAAERCAISEDDNAGVDTAPSNRPAQRTPGRYVALKRTGFTANLEVNPCQSGGCGAYRGHGMGRRCEGEGAGPGS